MSSKKRTRTAPTSTVHAATADHHDHQTAPAAAAAAASIAPADATVLAPDLDAHSALHADKIQAIEAPHDDESKAEQELIDTELDMTADAPMAHNGDAPAAPAAAAAAAPPTPPKRMVSPTLTRKHTLTRKQRDIRSCTEHCASVCPSCACRVCCSSSRA